MILTFFLLSLLVLFLDDWTGGWTTMHLFCVYRSSLKLKRHTLPQLLIGSAVSLLACGISIWVYGLG